MASANDLRSHQRLYDELRCAVEADFLGGSEAWRCQPANTASGSALCSLITQLLTYPAHDQYTPDLWNIYQILSYSAFELESFIALTTHVTTCGSLYIQVHP